MIYMHHFYVFAKNNLHLELGAGYPYLPRIREGLFPGTPQAVRHEKGREDGPCFGPP